MKWFFKKFFKKEQSSLQVKQLSTDNMELVFEQCKCQLNNYANKGNNFFFSKKANWERISGDCIDGKSIDQVERELQEHDKKPFIKRILSRWFLDSGIEKRRSLFCYYYARQLITPQISEESKQEAITMLKKQAQKVSFFSSIGNTLNKLIIYFNSSIKRNIKELDSGIPADSKSNRLNPNEKNENSLRKYGLHTINNLDKKHSAGVTEPVLKRVNDDERLKANQELKNFGSDFDQYLLVRFLEIKKNIKISAQAKDNALKLFYAAFEDRFQTAISYYKSTIWEYKDVATYTFLESIITAFTDLYSLSLDKLKKCSHDTPQPSQDMCKAVEDSSLSKQDLILVDSNNTKMSTGDADNHLRNELLPTQSWQKDKIEFTKLFRQCEVKLRQAKNSQTYIRLKEEMKSQIKKAWRVLVLKHHSDKAVQSKLEADEVFKELTELYKNELEILENIEREYCSHNARGFASWSKEFDDILREIIAKSDEIIIKNDEIIDLLKQKLYMMAVYDESQISYLESLKKHSNSIDVYLKEAKAYCEKVDAVVKETESQQREIHQQKIMLEEHDTKLEQNRTKFEENKTIFEENKIKLEEIKTKFEENDTIFGENKVKLEEIKTKFEENDIIFEDNKTRLNKLEQMIKELVKQNNKEKNNKETNKNAHDENIDTKKLTDNQQTKSFQDEKAEINLASKLVQNSLWEKPHKEQVQPMELKTKSTDLNPG